MAGSPFITQVTKRLTRRYGQPVQFRNSTSVSDYESGGQTTTYEIKQVAKAIVLPQQVKPEVEEDLSYIASNRPYTYDALFDITLVRVIVLRSDLIGFVLTIGSEFLYHGHMHTIVDITDFEEGRSVLVRGRTGTGEPNGRVFDMRVANHIRMEDAASV